MNSSLLQKIYSFIKLPIGQVSLMLVLFIGLSQPAGAFNGVKNPDYNGIGNLGQCVTCPPEWITVTCSQLDPYLNYGEPYLSQECAPGSMVSGPYIIDDRIGCGSGQITKKWQIWTYWGEYTCIQHIMVTGGWGYPQINWPPDLILYGCSAGYQPTDLNPPYNKPSWWAPDCSNLMYTWRDEVYYPEDHSGVCLKIFRRWKIIDWCCYNVDDPNSGCVWTHTQLIKIMDNQPPVISCPPSMTVDAGPNCTGSYVQIPPASAYDNCGNVTIFNNSPYDVYGGADASGYYPPGTTTVTFTAKDICGNTSSCWMTITVKDKKKPTPVVHHGLTTNLMCMSPEPMIVIDPKWFDAGSFDNCTPKNQLQFSVQPNRFTCSDRGYNDIWITVTDKSGNSETVKTYVIIGDPNQCCGPDTSTPPTIVCPPDMTFNSEGPNCTGGFVTIPPATATSTCNGPITITNNSYYAVNSGANASGTYPVGTTVVTFTAKDYCGKIAKCNVKIVVRDGKKPTPVVFHGLAVSLMEDTINGGGRITLLPEWFDAGSFDNCTANRDLLFSVSPNYFNCDSLGIRNVWFTVTDESGNTEIVQTYVDIQDPNDFCNTNFTADVSGNILTENGDQVSSVDLHANSDSTDRMKNVDGSYLLDSLTGNVKYIITPEKKDNVVNGISTKDLIILRQHILGKSTIYSPYKLIAADVNGDKVINTQDLIILRKIVMGTLEEFPEGVSWKFVDMKYIFDPFVPALTQNYPSSVTIKRLRENTDNVSFIAVKLGDLNSTVLASGVPGQYSSRSDVSTKMYATKEAAEQGITTVNIKPTASHKMTGLQMAIRFNPADYQYLGLNERTLKADGLEFTVNAAQADRGILKISLVSDNPVSVTSSDILFGLNFKTLRSREESEVITLDNYAMQPELYETGDLTYNIELVNENVQTDNGFALFQNRPNPFQKTTEIGFTLPETQMVEFKVVDITGRVLMTQNKEYSMGLHTISLNMRLSSGVYFYTLKAGNNIDTKRMIVIE